MSEGRIMVKLPTGPCHRYSGDCTPMIEDGILRIVRATTFERTTAGCYAPGCWSYFYREGESEDV